MTEESKSRLRRFVAKAQPMVDCETVVSDSEQVTAGCSARRYDNGRAADNICTTAVARPQINGVRENEVKNSALIIPCNHLNYLPLLRIVVTRILSSEKAAVNSFLQNYQKRGSTTT